jgi:hypothetical protein
MRKLGRRKVMLVLALVLASWGANGTTPQLLAQAEEQPNRAMKFVEQLEKVVTFRTIDDPKTTLADAITLLEGRYNLKISVNERAFKTDGVMEVLKTEVAVPVPIPEMKAKLRAVLGKILDRLPALGPTYVIRKDSIELTTMAAVRQELGREDDDRLLPLTHVCCEKRPLEEVLKQLAGRTDYNIVFDARAGDKAKMLVSARFKNVPLDTAVRVLADMADLEPVLQDNVIYITTPEKAARMEKEQRKRKGLLGM